MNERDVRPGDKVSVSRGVTEKDIETFAELSLDRNQVHFNDEFASGTFFGRRIAHGMIGAALISGALTALMGDGNIWLSSSIKFEKPIYPGDILACALCVVEISRRGIADIDVCITNSNGDTVISGTVQSIVFVPRKH